MKPNLMSSVAARFVLLSILGGVVLLVWFLPVLATVIAAVLFVLGLVFVSFATGRATGFWSGVRHFIKEILFGW